MERGERTSVNSEIPPYSWPFALVFVDSWVSEEFSIGATTILGRREP